MMRRMFEGAARVLSRSLSVAERDAVLGDLTESGATPLEVVGQLSGLIIRRWALAWNGIGAWIALAGVAVPCGLSLSFITRWWAESASARLSASWTVWFPGYFAFPGTRLPVVLLLLRLAAEAVVLVAWAWAIGRALVHLAGRQFPTAVFVLSVLLFTATSGTRTTLARHGIPESFPLTAVLVMSVRLMLVVTPLLVAARRPTRRRETGTAAFVAAVATIFTLITITGAETAFTFGRGITPPPGPDGIVGTADDVRMWIPWIPLLLLWPAWYSTLAAARAPDRGRLR
jgi:hypothetical protein